MGWFIAQSLAFIIIAALIGLATGIWIGWLAWGRRTRGKHAAERAEAAARSVAAQSGRTAGAEKPAEATADAAKPGTRATKRGARTRSDAEPVPAVVGSTTTDETTDENTPGTAAVLPVADHTPEPGADASPSDTADTADAGDAGDTADGGTRPETGVIGSGVVAEAEAVARRAAESDTAVGTRARQADVPEAADAVPGHDATVGTMDDLRRIEGIGPKIASALVAAGYPTYARIAGATEEELREAVASQGIKFAPSANSWADQARHLVDRDVDYTDGEAAGDSEPASEVKA